MTPQRPIITGVKRSGNPATGSKCQMPKETMLQVTDYDVLATVIICFGVFGVAAWQGSRLGLQPWASALFATSALVLSFARYRVELSAPADAFGYYVDSLLGAEFDIGTGFMPFITSLLTVTLGMGFLPSMMFFSLFAIASMQICYVTFLQIGGRSMRRKWHALLLAAIVPSLGFWGSGIAKDAIVLLGISLFCLGVTRAGLRLPMTVGGIILVLLIRPHIGLMMIFGVVCGYLVAPGLSNGRRLAMLGLAAAAVAIIIPLTISYLGLGDLKSINDVNIQINTLAAGYEGTGSYVDLSSLPLPLKIISYLFRPFPWEAGSISQLAAAAQNMFIGLILVVTLPAFIRRRREWRLSEIATLMSFSISALVVLSITTANLGVASRQKWMVLIPVTLFLFWARAAAHTRPGHITRPVAKLPAGWQKV